MVKSNQGSREMPGVNCVVLHKERHTGQRGVVVGHQGEGEKLRIRVRWGTDGVVESHELAELRNGFRPGHIVQDRPEVEC